MCYKFSFAFVLGIVLTVLRHGYALECWKCNSIYDVTCRDHFNQTRILQNRRDVDRVNVNNYDNRQEVVRNDPHLVSCDEMYTARQINYKNVCLKKVVKGQNGMPPAVSRECRLVQRSLKRGECPEDIIVKTGEMEFCGTCEENGCNDAAVLKTSVLAASVIPVSLILFLRN